MTPRANQVRHLPLSIVSVAAILLCVTAIAVARAWMSASSDNENLAVAAELGSRALPESAAHVTLRCAECGVVASTREIVQIDAMGEQETDGRSGTGRMPSRSYEVTVRMRDGSSRVFVDATPGPWRPGQRITVIEDASQSRR